MKQLRTFWVSLVLLFSVDASAISIDLIPNHTNIAVGDQLALQVKISNLSDSNAPSLGVYDLDLNFNNNLFSFSHLIWGDNVIGNQLDLSGSGSAQTSTVNSGIINLFELSFDDIDSLNNLQAGEFTLFTLLFDAIAIGSGNFSIGNNIFGDAVGDLLTIDRFSDAQINISSVPVPEPSSLLLLLGMLAVILLRVRTSQSAK